MIRRDPNHYSKGVKKDGCALEDLYPDELVSLGKILKQHFIVTVKMCLSKDDWLIVWNSFIGHNFTNEHISCQHPMLPDNYEVRFPGTSKNYISDVSDELMSISGFIPAV